MDIQPWPLAVLSSSVKSSMGTTKALPVCAAHGIGQTAPMMVRKVGSKPPRAGSPIRREGCPRSCSEYTVGSLGTHGPLDGLEQVIEVPGHEPREALSHFVL